MSIDNIGSAPLGGLYGANAPYNAHLSGGTAANSAETTASGGLSSTNGFLQALSLTLQQSGLETPPVIAPPSSAGSSSEPGNNPPSGGAGQSNGNPTQDFLFALVRALSPNATGGSGNIAATPYASASLENRLQNLVSSLGSGAANASPTLRQLQAAFRNLSEQTGRASSKAAANNTPSLEQFLLTLTQNLTLNPQTAGQPLSQIGFLLDSLSA